MTTGHPPRLTGFGAAADAMAEDTNVSSRAVQDMVDWHRSIAQLAVQASWWEPGAASGHLAAGIVGSDRATSYLTATCEALV